MTYTINYSDGQPSSIQDGNKSIPLDGANMDFREFMEWNDQQEKPLDWQSPIVVDVPDPTPSAEDQITALQAQVDALTQTLVKSRVITAAQAVTIQAPADNQDTII